MLLIGKGSLYEGCIHENKLGELSASPVVALLIISEVVELSNLII